MSLEVTVNQNGAVTILRASGRLTLGVSIDHLRDWVDGCFEDGHELLILDLSGLAGADSAGVGELVSIYASIARRGGAMKFLKPSRKLREMFHVTRLESLFECYDDEAVAVASFDKDSNSRAASALGTTPE